MFITIHRHGPRALFVRAGTLITEVPLYALHWLGTIESSADAELKVDTPMLGLSPPAILYDITVHGFCVVDVPDISAVTPPRNSEREALAR
ncbi:hypothetical protein [Cupriavidus pauculus]|uniref:hypothetical protein n=1 Tax=Cupriavidus pauculus TaxID=82633 RepID=UPI001EE246F4|nr:hypothetical protein [Cupriavidus pauculus]GJG96736.1 hypothetical protein CBA19C6_19625 [Cupriavidus pauculus]